MSVTKQTREGEAAHVDIRVAATAGVELIEVPPAPLPLFQPQQEV